MKKKKIINYPGFERKDSDKDILNILIFETAHISNISLNLKNKTNG